MVGDDDDSSPHTWEFVCEDCGIPVVAFGYHDGVNACGVCKFIRSVPDMSEKMKTFLRGDHTEAIDINAEPRKPEQ